MSNFCCVHTEHGNLEDVTMSDPRYGVLRTDSTPVAFRLPSLAGMLVARQAAHGKGRAVLQASGTEAFFSELSYQYPLKLLSPGTNSEIPLAIAYILSYGGGLVSGDRIELDVDVGSHSMLMLLTQVRSLSITSRDSVPDLQSTLV